MCSEIRDISEAQSFSSEKIEKLIKKIKSELNKSEYKDGISETKFFKKNIVIYACGSLARKETNRITDLDPDLASCVM